MTVGLFDDGVVGRCIQPVKAANTAFKPIGDGLASQFGIVALLHRSIEGVHIDMDDLSNRKILGLRFADTIIGMPVSGDREHSPVRLGLTA